MSTEQGQRKKQKLTKKFIDGLEYQKEGGKQDICWDEQVNGFGVRIYPSGRKSYVVFYRASGRQRIKVIANCEVMPLDVARRKAKQIIAEAIDGKDAIVEERKSKNFQTVAALANDCLNLHSKPNKKSWQKDESRFKRLVVPNLGKLRVDEVTQKTVASFHRKISKENGPYEANRCLELISLMYSKGEQWGYSIAANPARGVTKNREQSRDRWVNQDEFPRLAKAINEEPLVYARYAFWLYLFTGLRKNELLRAKWEDVDWDRREIQIPETKSGRKHYLPLSKDALKTLRQIPREEGNSFIFPGAKKGEHLVNIDKAWIRVKKSAGLEDVRLHDLRRTAGSWLVQQGHSLHLVGKILNHSSPQTTMGYARFAQDNLREALDGHGEEISKLAQVVPLRAVA